MLQTFLPLFLMTFGICLFIVLMQFLWRYIDDMVGKGLGIPVLAEMFMYAALFLVPMALPLAILLASLMTFGNLGERLELLAMKSAGVSLIHIMRPLIVTLLFVSVGAFFFQNNVMPVVQVKLYTLLYSMRQKSPELDIPEGSFYKDIPGFNVYVKKKDPKDGLLKDVMIYDYSEGFNNARVIVADSGRLKTSADKLFLVLSLFNGESFENVGKSQANTTQARTAVPYRRESFSSKDILIEFDANFNRTDESFMQNQYMGKNLKDLQTSIDSMGIRLDSIKDVNAKSIYDASYVKTLKSLRAKKESEAEGQPDEQQEKLPVITPTIQLDFDSLYLAQAVPYRRESFSSKDILIEFDANFNRTDESFMQNQYMGKNLKDLQTSIDSMGIRLDSIKDVNAKSIYDASYVKTLKSLRAKKESEAEGQPDEQQEKLPVITPTIQLDFDSLYLAQAASSQAALLGRAKSSIENIKTDYYFRAATVGDEAYKVRRHLTEWHKKFTVSFACIMFFFIGAPLGAIIRKGGLGVPVVISVILFIFYYIIDNMGFKMARDGVWDAWEGMWLSSVVLTPMGIFLTYKAVKDSVILNADTYVNALKNLIGKREGRKVERKEVIIYTPDYEATLPQLEKLVEESTTYLTNHKRWINYLTFWKQGGKDNTAELLAQDTENIVEELSNSDQNLLLNKLMDYPVIGGYNNKLSKHINGKLALAIGIFFPLGLPIYLLATYQRKLLRHDIVMVQKTSKELINMIYSLHLLKK